MDLNLDAVGTRTDAVLRTWNPSDSLLYALSVGATPSSLHLVTDNSVDVKQQQLPTFVTTRTASLEPIWQAAGITDLRRLVHGGQLTEVPAPLATDGEVSLSAALLAIYDTGRHAILEVAHEGRDVASDNLVYRCVQTLVFRDAGGFGGPATPERRRSTIDSPDDTVTVDLLETQALWYRLNGDRNPLHSDPTIAQRAGFDRPILHGLCTYGIAARVAIEQYFDDDHASFESFDARFTGPVYPGTRLDIHLSQSDAGISVTVVNGGRVVLDDGLLVTRL